MSGPRIVYLETRLDNFEDRLRHIEEIVIRIDERLAANLPHLATKEELSEKPSRLSMWGVMAALTGAYIAARPRRRQPRNGWSRIARCSGVNS
jgi:hypothetical protein